MVPGLGLYLNELFFDTYNIRVQRNFDPSKARDKSKPETPADNEDDANDEGDNGQETSNEELLWHSDPQNIAKFQRFKDDIIWRHVFDEEERAMGFLEYLNHLRIHPYSYVSREYNKNGPGKNQKRKIADDDE